MKKITIALILVISVVTVIALSACADSYQYTPIDATVRYMTNIDGETLTLTSGREAVAENTVYHSESVKTGQVLTPPKDPVRPGYVFKGWATDKEGTKLFDFSTTLTGSLNLYAAWERSAEATTGEESYIETRLTFVEKIDDSTPFSLTAVCNQPISAGAVDLTTVGINRLSHKASDVREYLTYTRASSTTINSATYAAGVVSVSYTSGGANNVIDVTVNDISASLEITDDPATNKNSIDESTFETKAKRYEDPTQRGNSSSDFDYYGSYEVIMGGSSSMENWSASSEYMSPARTKNVGIGGSSAAYWRDTLADRLIIPFNPRAVILYVGINDIINYKQSGAVTADNLKGLFRHIHECLPDTTIHYILINKVPGYYDDVRVNSGSTETRKQAIDHANEAIIEFAAGEGKGYMNIIDAGVVLEKKSGEYSQAYFKTDLLHMSLAGYELWGAVVKADFIAKEKEIYNG